MATLWPLAQHLRVLVLDVLQDIDGMASSLPAIRCVQIAWVQCPVCSMLNLNIAAPVAGRHAGARSAAVTVHTW